MGTATPATATTAATPLPAVLATTAATAGGGVSGGMFEAAGANADATTATAGVRGTGAICKAGDAFPADQLSRDSSAPKQRRAVPQNQRPAGMGDACGD